MSSPVPGCDWGRSRGMRQEGPGRCKYCLTTLDYPESKKLGYCIQCREEHGIPADTAITARTGWAQP